MDRLGPRSTSVEITIYTGLPSRGPGIQGLEALHGKKVVMDVHRTWEEEFKIILPHNAHAVLDPLRHTIRRCQPAAPRHDITESIRTWIGEFKNVTKKGYVVYVIENGKKKKAGRPRKTSNRQDSDWRNGKRPTSAATGRYSRKQPNGRTSQRRHGLETQPLAADSDTDTVPVPPTQGTSRNASNQNGRRPVSVPPLKHKFEEETFDVDEAPGQGNASFDHQGDDDDVLSQITAASQSSQEELTRRGIVNEDFKPVFIMTCMDEFSNATLLTARKEWEDLFYSNAYTKFARNLPPTIQAILTKMFIRRQV